MCTVVKLSPTALFQIIKDIKMGPSVEYSSGHLYGMPPDDTDPSIEVTHAFPDFSRKFTKRPTDEQDLRDYKADINRFTKDHLNSVCTKLNYDTENVGWYTSRNCGRYFSLKDLSEQYKTQKEESSFFCLVVDMSSSTLSLRAFRIKDAAMAYLSENQFGVEYDVPVIDDSMRFENLLEEFPVSFKLSNLEHVILNQILSSYSLVTDVFRLRDHKKFESHMPDIADSMTNISDELNYCIEDAAKVRDNRERRAAYIKERKETNKKRVERGLAPLSEDDVNYDIPLRKQCNKVNPITDIYTFNAKSAALRAELEEEITKISVLTALDNDKQ